MYLILTNGLSEYNIDLSDTTTLNSDENITTIVPTESPTSMQSTSSVPTLQVNIIQDDDYVYNPVKKNKNIVENINILDQISESSLIILICFLSFVLTLPCACMARKWFYNENYDTMIAGSEHDAIDQTSYSRESKDSHESFLR